tara:strand:- start:165 stop:398 length:234 start_codon:yes stop_codon:yes gene_type:complete
MAKKKATKKKTGALITKLAELVKSAELNKDETRYTKHVLKSMIAGERMTDITLAELTRIFNTDDQLWFTLRMEDDKA